MNLCIFANLFNFQRGRKSLGSRTSQIPSKPSDGKQTIRCTPSLETCFSSTACAVRNRPLSMRVQASPRLHKHQAFMSERLHSILGLRFGEKCHSNLWRVQILEMHLRNHVCDAYTWKEHSAYIFHGQGKRTSTIISPRLPGCPPELSANLFRSRR